MSNIAPQPALANRNRSLKITLVIPPAPYLLNDRVFPSLGPLLISAIYEAKGHQVEVLDLSGHHLNCSKTHHKECLPDIFAACTTKMQQIDADVVGFYGKSCDMGINLFLLNRLREVRPEIITLLGGPHANIVPEECATKGFDYLVVGESGGMGGENSALKALELIEQANLKRPKKPIILREPSGTDMDQWPYPDRDKLDMDTYAYEINGQPASHIFSVIGCPYACKFCSHWGGKQGYRKMRYRSIPNVIGEIQLLKNKYNLHALMDFSDEINANHKHLIEYCEALEKEKMTWRAFFKANLFNQEQAQAIARAGCHQACTGAESGDPGILKWIDKKCTQEDNTRFVKLCLDNGITPKVFCQIGLPGESYETAMNTQTWLLKMADLAAGYGKHLDFDMTVYCPYPGTPIYEQLSGKKDLGYDIVPDNPLDYWQENDSFHFKGIPGEYIARCHTSKLTALEIVELRDKIESHVRKEQGLAPVIIKDEG